MNIIKSMEKDYSSILQYILSWETLITWKTRSTKNTLKNETIPIVQNTDY